MGLSKGVSRLRPNLQHSARSRLSLNLLCLVTPNVPSPPWMLFDHVCAIAGTHACKSRCPEKGGYRTQATSGLPKISINVVQGGDGGMARAYCRTDRSIRLLIGEPQDSSALATTETAPVGGNHLSNVKH